VQNSPTIEDKLNVITAKISEKWQAADNRANEWFNDMDAKISKDHF
jgi:hypothetical protein